MKYGIDHRTHMLQLARDFGSSTWSFGTVPKLWILCHATVNGIA